MADFIPDGHKYGWKLGKPWGLSPDTKDRFNLYVSDASFTIKTNGGGAKVLGLLGTWVENATQSVYDGAPAQVYFKLGYQEDGTVPWTYARLDSNPVGQPLEANEYLVRFTVSCKAPAGTSAFLNVVNARTDAVGATKYYVYCVQNLFHSRPIKQTQWHWSWAIAKEDSPELYNWDCCFEFSADKSPDVTEFSVCIDSSHDVEEISPDNGFILYLDDYQELQSGGGIMTQPVDPRSVKTIAQPSPMGLLYKHTNGALYQMNTSNYATQAEYEALLARVVALESKANA